MTQAAVNDRIERDVFIRAPLSRVWEALTDDSQFGQWFGVRLSGPFTAGGRVHATVTGEKMTGVTFDIFVQEIVPPRLFSWRWYAHDVAPGAETPDEPMTLVEFHLEAAEGGTRLRVIESGFDRVPASQRLQSYRNNSEGWTIQVANIERHVTTR